MPLTDDERSVMAESEIAQYESAEAAKLEAEEERQREEAEATRKAEIDAAVAEAVADLKRSSEEESRQREAVVQPPTDVYEKLAQLQYDDPVAYQKEIVRMATETAKEESIKEAEARYGNASRRVSALAVEDKLAEGLGVKGREYVKKYAHMISESNADDPLVQDLVRRGAKDYEREHTTKKEAVERTYEENVVVSDAERKMADTFAEIAARASGAPIEKLRLTNAQLIASREEE